MFGGTVLLLLVFVCTYCAPIQVHISEVLHTVPERFLSFTLDHYFLTSSYGPGDQKLTALASALAPGYIRVGGTTMDFLCYEGFGGPDCTLRHDSSTFGSGPLPRSTMNATQLQSLVSWGRATGHEVVFGLAGIGGVRSSPTSPWDSANAEALVHYAASRGLIGKGGLVGFMLGNEPDLWPKHNCTRSASDQPLDSLTAAGIAEKAGASFYAMDCAVCSPAWLSEWLKSAKRHGLALGAVTFHFYYGNQKTSPITSCYDPAVLDKYLSKVEEIQSVKAAAQYSHVPLWASETASFYGGGNSISHSYAAGFLWNDKLGASRALGIQLVARQSWSAGGYLLVNPATGVPSPDYFSALLHRRLLGVNVFSVANGTQAGRKLRVYASCAAAGDRLGVEPSIPAGSLALIVVNVGSSAATLDIAFTLLTESSSNRVDRNRTPPSPVVGDTSYALSYLLEPCDATTGKCRSVDPSVGVAATAVGMDGQLLAFDPTSRAGVVFRGSPSHGPVQVPPLAYGIVVYPDAKVSACM